MKNKIELEYTLNASPKIIYNRLSTPSGLAEWFAEDIHIKGNIYTFIWEGSEQQAELLKRKDNKQVRFRWIDEDEACDEDCYFEFKINQDELTGDVALMITDFVPDDEKDESIELWDSQISDLKHALGI